MTEHKSRFNWKDFSYAYPKFVVAMSVVVGSFLGVPLLVAFSIGSKINVTWPILINDIIPFVVIITFGFSFFLYLLWTQM